MTTNAPDLLEALKRLVNACSERIDAPFQEGKKYAQGYTQGWTDCQATYLANPAMKQAKEVIIKAEGKE